MSTDPPRSRIGALRRRDSGGMPPWLPRAFELAVITVVLFVAGLWLLLRLRFLLEVLLISLFLAFAIEPAVNWLHNRGWRRGAATGVLMLAAFIILAGFITALGSLLVTQVNRVIVEFPRYVDVGLAWVNQTFDAQISAASFRGMLERVSGQLQTYVSALAQNALGVGAAVLGTVFKVLAIVFFTFYLSAEGPRLRRAVCSLLPPHRQREALRIWEIAVNKTGGYIYSRALMGVSSALAHYLFFRFVLEIPYAFALALWVGVVSQLIPNVGTYFAALPPLLVALIVSPTASLWVLVFMVAYQQFENYVLLPRITAKTLNLHPAVAFAWVIAGGAILGPVGALLALPAGASVQAFTSTYVRRYQIEEHPLTELPDGDERRPATGEHPVAGGKDEDVSRWDRLRSLLRRE